MPEFGPDFPSIHLVGMKDSATTKAIEAIRPPITDLAEAARNPKRYPRLTRYRGSMFNGMDVDGVYIYPPFQVV